MPRNATSKNKKERNYAELHDLAVKRFFRARTTPFWAAALNFIGAFYLLITTVNSNPNVPSKFLLNGYSEWLRYFLLEGLPTNESEFGLFFGLFVVFSMAISAAMVVVGIFASRPPRRSFIIANLAIQSGSVIGLLIYYTFFWINHGVYGLTDFFLSALVQGIILFFSISYLIYFDRVIKLEKEFAGQNVTILDTRVVTSDEIENKEKEEKDYEFLKK